MNLRNRNRGILLVLCSLSFHSGGFGAIDFSTVVSAELVSSFSENGFTITGTGDDFYVTTNGAMGAGPRMDAWASFSVARTDGGAFRFDSFLAREAMVNPSADWGMEGTLVGGGSVSDTLTIVQSAAVTYTVSGFTGLNLLTFTPLTGGSGGSFDTFMVTPIPEVKGMALLLGLISLALIGLRAGRKSGPRPA